MLMLVLMVINVTFSSFNFENIYDEYSFFKTMIDAKKCSQEREKNDFHSHKMRNCKYSRKVQLLRGFNE